MESKNQIIGYGQFAVISGCLTHLDEFDFSSWNMVAMHISSMELKSFIEKHSKPKSQGSNWRIIINDLQQATGGGLEYDYDKLNFLIPRNFLVSPSREEYFQVVDVLRLAYPSEIFVRNIIDVSVYDSDVLDLICWTIEHRPQLRYCPENPYKYWLPFMHEAPNYMNEFLKFCKEKMDSLDYVQNAMKYFSNAYRLNDQEMAYVSICICLESIVPDNEQLAFRFRRNLGVICGKSLESGNLIVDSAKKIYKLRSKIVHCSMTQKEYNNFEKYFEHAQLLASRMLIEMIAHRIPTIEELDKKINECGIGDGNKISSDYKEVIINQAGSLKLLGQSL